MEQIDQPVTQPEPVFSSPKPNRKPILYILLGILILSLLVSVVVLARQVSQLKNQVGNVRLAPSPKPEPGFTPAPGLTAGWQTYQNQNEGYEIKYPSGTKLEEVGDPIKDGCVILTIGNISLRIKTPAVSYCGFTGGDSPTRQNPLGESFNILGKNYSNAGMDFVYIGENNEEMHNQLFRFEDVPGNFYLEISGNYTKGVDDQSYLENKEKIILLLSTFKFIDQVDSTTSWKTYTSDKYGFKIKYPTGWGMGNYEEELRMICFDPESVVSSEILKKINFPCGLIEIVFHENVNNITNYEKLDSVTIGEKIRAKFCEEKAGESQPNLAYQNKHILNYYVGRNIQISYIGDAEDKYLKTFNQILSTFEFID